MANEFLKAQRIIDTSVGVLDREIVLQKMVWSDAVADWAGVQGETVNLRVPGRLKGRSRKLRTGTPLTIDSLGESLVPLKLTDDIYSGVKISDEELTLDIRDFTLQVAEPQMRAVSQQLEDSVASLMVNAPYVKTITVDPANPHLAVLAARRFLNDHFVPMDQRYGVIGSAMDECFLGSKQLTQYDHSGDTTAFHEAQIGRIYGNALATAMGMDPALGVIFHRTAFATGLRAPVVPDGASFGATRAWMGLAMRWIRDYDPLNVSDRSLFSTYYGGSIVTDLVDPTDNTSGQHFVRAVRLELPVSSIAVDPATEAIGVADTAQVTATVTYADGTTRDVTNEAVWASSATSKATVAAGLVTGVAAGTSNVTAAYGGFTSTACAVTVS